MVLAKSIVAIAGLAITLASLPVNAEPFPTSDQNPLLSGFGLSTPWSTRFKPARSQSLSTILNWSSTAVIEQSHNESLIVDAESRAWRLDWQYSMTDRMALQVKLPYRTFSGGTLDSFIDNWHSTFGLPQGARPLQPHDQYQINYLNNGVTQLSDTRAHSSIGNVQIEAGYQAHSGERNATSLWITSKLPTASNSPLSSAAFDLGGGVASEWQLGSHWNISAQAAIIHLGPGQALRNQQRQWLTQAFIDFDYLATHKLTLSAQFETHSAVFRDSNLKQLDSAWIMTLGGTYRFNQRWHAQLGVSEDIKVESSPDVNFLFSLTRAWR